MILNNSSQDVSRIGNISKNKVSIDAKNINHIVTILSSNLYSKPKESFLRETVSNAIDSHKEAGNKEPVIITIADDYLSIRDYGTGISPERFNDIYLNIGSSTKRESNDYIGSFGIGRFSALSVSNLVNVISYYNGTRYHYVMVKDNASLSIDLLDTSCTKEHNGVMINIPLSEGDAYDYIDLLPSLAFFGNIYIDCKATSSNTYTAKKFNERTITEGKTYKITNIGSHRGNCLIGNVMYPIIWCADNTDDIHDMVLDVCPVFNIGDLDITPNREAILYSDRSKKKIAEVYKACYNELLEFVKSCRNKDYDDIFEFLDQVGLGHDSSIHFNSKYYTIHNMVSSATYKGKNRNAPASASSSFYSVAGDILGYSMKAVAIWQSHSLYRGKNCESTFGRLLFNSRWGFDKGSKMLPVLIVPSSHGFSSKYLEGFLDEKYGDIHKMIILSKKDFKALIKEWWESHVTAMSSSKTRTWCLYLIKEVIRAICKDAIYLDISTSQEYKEYKDAEIKSNKANMVFTKNITYYLSRVYDDYIYTNRFNSSDLKGAVAYVEDNIKYAKEDTKSIKRYMFYTLYDDPRIEALKLIYKECDCVRVLSVAKTNERALKMLPSKFRPIHEAFSYKNPRIRTMMTLRYIIDHSNHLKVLMNQTKEDGKIYLALVNLLRRLPIEHKESITRLLRAMYKTRIIPKDLVIWDDAYLDTQLIADAKLALKYIKIMLSEPYDAINRYTVGEMTAFMCMKNKLFRINYDTYKTIKSLKVKLC